MRKFKIPKDGQTYTHNVIDRCRDLINHGIWNGIEIVNLNSWLKNFKTDLELYFAACLLDSFIFKSTDQTISMGKELFIKKIPLYLNSHGYSFKNYRSFIDHLNSNKKDIKIISVTKTNDPPGKSSEYLIRLYKRKLGINQQCFYNPSSLNQKLLSETKVLIFIDDILSTGRQFSDLYIQIEDKLDKTLNIYSPLAAHIDGLINLNTNCPKVRTLYCELLDYDSDFFRAGFNDGINDENNSKIFYDNLIAQNKIAAPEDLKYGYGQLSLTYTFDLSVPDNCLPIIWWKNNNWKPLILR